MARVVTPRMLTPRRCTIRLDKSQNLPYVPLLDISGPEEEGDGGLGQRTAKDELDVVQFASQIHFVDESEEVLSIDIMRFGMHGLAKVKYRTEDGSAKASEDYEASSGEIVLGEGQSDTSIQIKIINSPSWKATLEFKVHLFDADNCKLGLYLKTCRVKVIDSDVFPSSKYRTTLETQGAQAVSEAGLIWEYLKLVAGQKGIGWRTAVSLILDELDNVYIYFQIRLQMFLVDVVLNTKDPATEDQLLMSSRHKTVIIVGVLFFLPMLVIHIAENVQVKLALSNCVKVFVQTNLFRKYLNYTEESRKEVSETLMHTAICDLPVPLAQSYMSMTILVSTIVRICMMLYFTMSKNPDALWILLLMPVLMIPFGVIRLSMLLKARAAWVGKNGALGNFVHETCRLCTLIAEYMQRPQMNDLFAQKSLEAKDACLPGDQIQKNNELFTRWLAPIFIGAYIIMFAPVVIEGDLSLGVFLATIGIIKAVAADFSCLFGATMGILCVAVPLRTVTTLFNKKTDVRTWKEVNQIRRTTTKEKREKMQEAGAGTDGTPIADVMSLAVDDMSFQYKDGPEVFKDVNVHIEQGWLIAIWGQHGGGKKTFLELLGHKIFPSKGSIFMPTHLRICHISQGPAVINMSAWRNLVFGDPSAGFDRVKCILKEMKMEKMLDIIENPGATEGDGDGTWLNTISYTERAKINLARAFIMNPEVLVLQRPLFHFYEHEQVWMLDVIRKHVRYRGLGLPDEGWAYRRPRTCFFSPETRVQAEAADIGVEIVGMSLAEMELNPDNLRKSTTRLSVSFATGSNSFSAYGVR